MPSCSILWCKNRTILQSKSYNDTTYHRFPKTPSIKQIWSDATGRSKEWIPTISSRICSIHFEPDLFIESKNGKRTYLKKSAVPTLHLPYHVTQNFDRSNVKRDPLSETESNGTNRLEPYFPTIVSKDPLESTTNGGADGATTEKMLNNQIRKLQYRDECSKQKIKRLQYRVRVQNKKIATLEVLVRALKRKSSLTEEEKIIMKEVDIPSAKIIKSKSAQPEGKAMKIQPK